MSTSSYSDFRALVIILRTRGSIARDFISSFILDLKVRDGYFESLIFWAIESFAEFSQSNLHILFTVLCFKVRLSI